MTLITGIKCAGGVVLAADSAATYGNLSQHTIVQNSASKLVRVAELVTVGVSGPVGFSQRVPPRIEAVWQSSNLANATAVTAMETFAQCVKQVVVSELPLMLEYAKVLGPAAQSSVVSQTLIAAPVAGEARLFQFDHQGAPEEATAELPFVAIGSGANIADPFLAFLRRLFWPSGLPTVGDAVLSAVWTLDHTIRTHPGGVGGPIHIVTLEQGQNGWTVREFGESQVQEHLQVVQAAEARLRTFRDELTPGANEAHVPQPPGEHPPVD